MDRWSLELRACRGVGMWIRSEDGTDAKVSRFFPGWIIRSRRVTPTFVKPILLVMRSDAQASLPSAGFSFACHHNRLYSIAS
jgi:hypothetical protein